MKIQCKDCCPSCEFCLYAKRSLFIANGVVIKICIEGCEKHSDEHHQSMARTLGYCKDFHCSKIKEDSYGT